MEATEGSRRPKRTTQIALPARWIRKHQVVECQAADINEDGMFLCTHEEIQPGTLLHLELTLAGRCRLMMFVRAVFVGVTQSGHGIAVEIHVMDEVERITWEEYYRSEIEPRSFELPYAP